MVPNLLVYAGDNVYVLVSWSRNSHGQGEGGVGAAEIFIENLTRGYHTQLRVCAGATPAKSSAEWIMDRPRVPTRFHGASVSQLPDLAGYGTTYLSGLSLGDIFCCHNPEQITMYDGSDVLSVYSPPVGPTTYGTFTWKNFY